jgi:formylglycine-generating enzyme
MNTGTNEKAPRKTVVMANSEMLLDVLSHLSALFAMFLAISLCVCGAPRQGCAADQGYPTGADNPALPAPAVKEDCGCRLDLLKLLAANTDSGQNGNVADESVPAPIAERIKRIGELLTDGNNLAAKEMLREIIRECDASQGSLKDCSQWAKALRGLDAIVEKPSQKIMATNALGMKLVKIPSGEYMMGSPKREMDWLRLTFKKTWREGHKQWFQDEMPMHPVRITRSFYIGATVVTVAQFRQFVNDTQYKTDAEKGDGGMIFSHKEERWTPQKGMKWDTVPWQIADNQPVVFVSWNDAVEFCKWLSRKEKRTYRLPTEAEWEMACRGGQAWVRYPWGDRLPGDHDTNFGDGSAKLPESLTTVNDGFRHVSPVTAFPPNGFGLYDMAGNVMQWVQDRYDRNYYDGSPLDDPQGPSSGVSRINKGGNWYASPADCRCAFRGFSGPSMSFWNLGFRVVMEDDDSTSVKQDKSAEAKTAALPPSEDDGLRLFREAMFAAQQQQWDQGIQDLEEALKIYEQREDYKWIPRVKATLAGIYAERNRTYKGKELYTQALAEFRKVGDTGSAKIVLARLQDLETSPGVKVVQVKKGGIAEKVGIVPGDIIIEYGGETGFRVAAFKKLVEDYMNARQVTLSIMNNNEITTTTVSGGVLGVALEDIKKPPRPKRPPEEDRSRERQRQRPRGRR